FGCFVSFSNVRFRPELKYYAFAVPAQRDDSFCVAIDSGWFTASILKVYQQKTRIFVGRPVIRWNQNRSCTPTLEVICPGCCRTAKHRKEYWRKSCEARHNYLTSSGKHRAGSMSLGSSIQRIQVWNSSGNSASSSADNSVGR